MEYIDAILGVASHDFNIKVTSYIVINCNWYYSILVLVLHMFMKRLIS